VTNYPGFKYYISLARDFRGQHIGFLKGQLANINNSTFLPVSFFTTARIRQESQDEESRHGTLGAGFMVTPNYRPDPCDFTMNFEFEKTPSEQGEQKIHYERVSGMGQVRCNLSKQTSFVMRGFRGTNRIIGTAPRNANFWPQNLDEARVRIDVPISDPHLSLNSFGGDLLFPFIFPFDVHSYILTKKMKMKLFYDFGEGDETTYRAAGMGLIFPIGGDVSGVGQLSITKLSILGVLYQSLNDEEFDQSILFDISGKL